MFWISHCSLTVKVIAFLTLLFWSLQSTATASKKHRHITVCVTTDQRSHIITNHSHEHLKEQDSMSCSLSGSLHHSTCLIWWVLYTCCPTWCNPPHLSGNRTGREADHPPRGSLFCFGVPAESSYTSATWKSHNCFNCKTKWIKVIVLRNHRGSYARQTNSFKSLHSKV